MIPTHPRRLVVATALLTGLAGCSADQAVTSPSAAGATAPSILSGPNIFRDASTQAGAFVVCKKGGAAGTYSFQLSATGGGDWALVENPTITFDGVNMACAFVANQINPDSWLANPTSTVTVTEVNLSATQKVDSIEVYNSNTGAMTMVTNSATVTQQMNYGDIYWFKYYNGVVVKPPKGNEGCLPIFWKFYSNWWGPTGYSKSQAISTVFTVPSSYKLLSKPLGNYTLSQSLTFFGGFDTAGAAQILLRTGVGALLNAEHPGVNFSLTKGDVVGLVNGALASGDKRKMLLTAMFLEWRNFGCGGGCPLY